MKKYTINFKLQAVSSRTKPILLVLNLNTKTKHGQYLNVSKSIGRSVLTSEWDSKRGLPNEINLATKLLELKNIILFKMAEHQGLNDEDLIAIHQKDYFKNIVGETIDREFHGRFSETSRILADVNNHTLTNTQTERDSIKDKINKLNYRLVNAEGHLIDLDKFFSSLNYYPSELKMEKTVVVKPMIKNVLGEVHDMHATKVWEYIVLVAEKKLRNEVLNKEGVADYKNKISAKFKEFDEEITLRELTDDVVANFFLWLRENFDYSANYYANFKKWMKAVVRFAIIEDKIPLPYINYDSKVYQQNKEPVSYPYLTEPMLKILKNLEFEPSKKHLEYTRDLFYISSYTGGIAFGDLKQVFNIQSRIVEGHLINYIVMVRTKTGTPSEIPLMDDVYDILKKYDFKFKSITNQYYNKNIQEICQLAGFTDNFIQVRKNIKTSEQVSVETPFYKLIGSHTARRSFCTNFYYHREMSAALLMQFSQHSKLESFLNYVQASAKVKFDEFAKRVVITERNERSE